MLAEKTLEAIVCSASGGIYYISFGANDYEQRIELPLIIDSFESAIQISRVKTLISKIIRYRTISIPSTIIVK